MSAITAVFFDVGGVLLTNGWDRHARARAGEHFGLSADDFAERHEQVLADFETNRLSEDQYLDRTVFHRPRDFSRADFRAFMYAQSRPLEDGALEIVDAVRRRGDILLATLNNESADLNAYRIERFGLRDRFHLFLSSCWVGLRKPEEPIYRLALNLTQREAGECLFVDDRALNTQCARLVGIRSIDYRGSADLRHRLAEAGIALG